MRLVLLLCTLAPACAAHAPGSPTSTPTPTPAATATIDASDACAGADDVAAALPFARADRVDDPPLLAAATGAPGEGKLCGPRIVTASVDVVVWRKWDRSRPDGRLGRWWSLSTPVADVAEYRRQYAICPEWNALDRTVRCTLRAGARAVLGAGQSAKCADNVSFPSSAAPQLFVPDPMTSLAECSDVATPAP